MTPAVRACGATHPAHGARESVVGSQRIRGERLKQQMSVAKSNVQKYTQDLRRVGPAGQSWGTFLRNHASEIWGVTSRRRMMPCFAVSSCS
jgi:hypothetical protein